MTSLARSAYRILPDSVRGQVRKSIRSAGDLLHPDLPPSHVRSWISPLWFDFEATGRDQLTFFVELAGLRPADSFLDVACGVGRIAIPLTRFLNADGRYEGFDISKDCIDWCAGNITPKHPNFNFTVADIKTTWTPGGRYDVADYVFPYEDSSFDMAYAGSIFTHIRPTDAHNYLEQIKRVLKPGGRLVATWLLFRKDWQQLLPGGSDVTKYWTHDCGDYRLKSLEAPEASVLCEESLIRRLYKDAGLTIVEPVRFDASYCASRMPPDRRDGLNLLYSCCIIAVRES